MPLKKADSQKKQPEVRWRRRKENRPDEILNAAMECFVERGYAGTRLNEIAARANVTKGTLYLYFRNKEEIFESVVRKEVVNNIANFEKIAADKSLSAAALIKQLFEVWAQTFALTQVGALPKIIISEGRNFPEITRFYLEAVAARLFHLVEGVIRVGITRGEFRAVNIENTAHCIVAPALFAMIWKQTFEPHNEGNLDIKSLLDTHFSLLIKGLCSELSK